MGRTVCTEPQCLYKGDLYLFLPLLHQTSFGYLKYTRILPSNYFLNDIQLFLLYSRLESLKQKVLLNFSEKLLKFPTTVSHSAHKTNWENSSRSRNITSYKNKRRQKCQL